MEREAESQHLRIEKSKASIGTLNSSKKYR